jgi:hypothetical protein
MLRVISALLAALLLTFGTSGIALGAARESSDCVAVLTSFFGPQGLVDDAAHILQAVAATQGNHLGDLASAVAREEGSLNECLALLPV